MQGVQRYVVFAYLALGVVAWATVSKLLAALAFAVNAPDFDVIGNRFTASDALGFLLATGALVVCFRNERIYGYSAEVVAELKKVTWPSREETRRATVVVIIATLVMAFLLGIFDFAWGGLTGLLY